ncbi:MAG: GC-type dockerin domain-anchored protein, partial [Planctomycetota bacterium]
GFTDLSFTVERIDEAETEKIAVVTTQSDQVILSSSTTGMNNPPVTFPNGRVFQLTDFPSPCAADTNRNGSVDPSDFNAWIALYNADEPGCDQNSDGLCTPADFNAWVLNFNAGC